MTDRIKEIAHQAAREAQTERTYLERIHNRALTADECSEIYNKAFAEIIIGHATECVRDVLREQGSALTGVAASQVQKRIKDFFGVKW